MEIDVTFRHLSEDSHAATRTYIEQEIEKHLSLKLERFHTESLRFHVVVEQPKQEYNIKFHLYLPHKKMLVAHATDKHLSPAIDIAMSKLVRQAEKY